MGVAPEDVDDVIDVLTASDGHRPRGYLHALQRRRRLERRGPRRSRATRSTSSTRSSRIWRVGVSRLESSTPPTAPAPSVTPTPDSTMVRVGLALYGYLPQAWLASALEESGERLEPALSLRAKRGRRSTRRCRGATELSAAPSPGRSRHDRDRPFGYADGYPRRLFDAGAEVLINGTALSARRGRHDGHAGDRLRRRRRRSRATKWSSWVDRATRRSRRTSGPIARARFRGRYFAVSGPACLVFSLTEMSRDLAELPTCTRCALSQSRQRVVVGSGPLRLRP